MVGGPDEHETRRCSRSAARAGQVPIFEELAEDAANHHECLDGREYFRGLTAGNLTPTARVLAVADVPDALMSARP